MQGNELNDVSDFRLLVKNPTQKKRQPTNQTQRDNQLTTKP
jgi:hypothetical protein